jgi:fluoride exporter
VDKTAAYLMIGLGSALGGMGRFWLSGLIAQRVGETFHWGTLVVNVSGSLVIGFLAAMMGPESRLSRNLNPFIFYFLMVGICGGYTTFSAFSLQTLNLIRNGQWLHAGANAVLSLAFCLAAVWAGHSIGHMINR